MVNTLVAPGDLLDFPGAPFAQAVVDAVAESVRGETQWHIAPQVTETVVVESLGGPVLLLPTLRLTSVAEVRSIADDGTATVITGYRTAATPRFRAGLLERSGGWSGVYEVDIVHGYAACPADLLPAIAFLCRRSRSSGGSVRLGSLSVSQDNSDPEDRPDAAVARYRIPPRP